MKTIKQLNTAKSGGSHMLLISFLFMVSMFYALTYLTFYTPEGS